jgi:Secretion system C-terminal sorting domain
MKHLLVSVGLLLCTGASLAQTVELNQEKYWKFRNSFKEKFVKIGPDLGESLPAGIRKPMDCIDNINNDGSGMGEMHWGDGIIRHGHYLTLLATEYRLLKNNGQHAQAQATLNELYYALNAIFRLDLNAEENQNQAQNLNTYYAYPLNGFYNREDVNEFFSDNWVDDRMEIRCTNSAFYTNNNAAKINDPSSGLVVKGNSYQNLPSLDQMTSLLVGLSMVNKLVDPIVVQPTPQDQPKDVVLFAKDIVYFMITYAAENNWFLLDVNGWPVNNKGGDLIICGAPVKRIYERIWGGYLNSTAHRKPFKYDLVQEVVTGYGLEDESDLTLADLNIHPIQYAVYGEIMLNSNWCYPAPTGTYATSKFLNWQNCGLGLDIDALIPFWQSFVPNQLPGMYEDYLDDQRFNTTFAGTPSYYGFGYFEFDNIKWGEGINSILFGLGVASGWWDSEQGDDWATATGNRQYDLVNCVLNNLTPNHTAAFYKQYLDSLSFAGPYDLQAGYWNGSTTTNIKELYHNGGWGGENRWTNYSQSKEEGDNGIFNAMDYMIFYNLFHLQFSNQLPAYKPSWTCNCSGPVTASGTINEPADQDSYNTLNQKLAFLEVCQENVFYPVNNLVSSQFVIEPKFGNYDDMGIYPTKYQTENAAVLSGGDINVRTQFVICNGTLNVQTGGRVDVEVKDMIVNTQGRVDNSGEILVRVGTQLILKSGSKLTLRNGSKLKIEEGAKLVIEDGASLEYYNGAEIELLGPNSIIEHGGTIRTMDAATFSILSPAAALQKGKLFITSPNSKFLADAPSYFRLEGKGINDPFITINAGAKLIVDDPEISPFRTADCTVEIKGGGLINTKRPYYSYRVKYNSLATNGGMTVLGGHVFSECQFLNVPVKAPMNILNLNGFSASDCSFAATSTTLNPTDNSLVKVTGGMNVALSNCVFTGNRSYCLETSSLTQASTISGCTFNNLASSAVGATLVGIQDVSNVEFKVTGSTFQKLQYGINKSNGKLTLKCNYFNNNNINNVRVIGGCLLNMSINDLAGYNVLNKSLQNKNIELVSCTINLKNGYNFIETCTNTIYGSVTNTCIPPGCLLDFANNQWNTSNAVPSTALFQILSGNGFAMLPLVTTVAPKPACGFYDGPIVIGPPKTKSTFDTDGMPIIYSAIASDSIRLDDAIVAGMEKMTSYDSLGNDLEAVERFNEVYTADIDLSDSLTRELAWFAIEHMKSSLEDAVTHGAITVSQNTVSFEPHVAMYADALMRLSTSEIDATNYLTQFYHEIDKAHLLRVIGHSDKGLNILTELEACGLDSAEQAHLNYWKQEFEKDLVIEEIGFAALDSVIVIDTNDYLNPALVVNAYSFGAIIHDLNDIQYPNCSFFDHRDKRTGFGGMKVFPNPATDEVRISWNHPLMEGEGVLQVQQSDGRMVLTKKIDTNESTGITLRVSDWKPGVYQIKYRSPKGVVSTAQLVVQ